MGNGERFWNHEGFYAGAWAVTGVPVGVPVRLTATALGFEVRQQTVTAVINTEGDSSKNRFDFGSATPGHTTAMKAVQAPALPPSLPNTVGMRGTIWDDQGTRLILPEVKVRGELLNGATFADGSTVQELTTPIRIFVGDYTLLNVPVGASVRITVTCPGYRTQERTVTASADSTDFPFGGPLAPTFAMTRTP